MKPIELPPGKTCVIGDYEFTNLGSENVFVGTIPPIAEKEKRGKRVKRPKDDPYVRELKPKRDGINIPAVD